MKIMLLVLSLFFLSSLNSFSAVECESEFANEHSILVTNNNTNTSENLFFEIGLTNFSCYYNDCAELIVKDDIGNNLSFQIFNTTNTTNNKKLQRTIGVLIQNFTIDSEQNLRFCVNSSNSNYYNTTIRSFNEEFEIGLDNETHWIFSNPSLSLPFNVNNGVGRFGVQDEPTHITSRLNFTFPFFWDAMINQLNAGSRGFVGVNGTNATMRVDIPSTSAETIAITITNHSNTYSECAGGSLASSGKFNRYSVLENASNMSFFFNGGLYNNGSKDCVIPQPTANGSVGRMMFFKPGNPANQFDVDWIDVYNRTAFRLNKSNSFRINNLPVIDNLTITPSPASIGDSLKVHFNFSDELTRNIENETRWYINNTLSSTSINLTTLLGGNSSDGANITASIRVYDGFIWSKWKNTSVVNIGDITPPTFKGNRTSASSVSRDSTINLFVNTTDGVSVDIVRAEINNTQTKNNFTMLLDSGSISDGEWRYAYTTSTMGTHRVKFYAKDGSGNERNTGDDLIFDVVSVTTSSGSGGGGGITTIIQEKVIGSIPLLFFGGLTSIEFIILSTPRKQTKTLRFTNLGNASFEKANIFIEGNAKRYIKPFVCNLDLQDCKNSSINIKPKESLFLLLNGTFTEHLGFGEDGVIKLQENKDRGNTHEIDLVITRPPLYKIAIKPFSDATGFSELNSLIVVYGLTSLGIITIFYLAMI